MPNDMLREIFNTFRASNDKTSSYEDAWRKNGYKSKSAFFRQAANAAVLHQSCDRIDEKTIHISRISSTLMDLLTQSANENSNISNDFEESLRKVLNHILAL